MPSTTTEARAACSTRSLRANEARECTDTAAPVRRHLRRDAEKAHARRWVAVLAFLVLVSPLACGPAPAQLSQKPVQIIVPFAPGASADGAARIVANELGPRLGRQVVVEHRAGAGGVLGLQMLAKSAPDGDTLGVGATGALLLNPNLPSNPGPDLLRELAPVAKLIEVALVLVANPSTDPKSISDMIDRSKTTPGGLTYGSTGTNSSQHLSVELLKRETGANLVHVPYRGSAPAVVDVIAGQFRSRPSISPPPTRTSRPDACARSDSSTASALRQRRRSRPSPRAACRASGAPPASSGCLLRRELQRRSSRRSRRRSPPFWRRPARTQPPTP
jgi:hypothetical protein